MFNGKVDSIEFKINDLDISIMYGYDKHYMTILRHDNDTTYRTIIYFDKLLELIDSNPEHCFLYDEDAKF